MVLGDCRSIYRFAAPAVGNQQRIQFVVGPEFRDDPLQWIALLGIHLVGAVVDCKSRSQRPLPEPEYKDSDITPFAILRDEGNLARRVKKITLRLIYRRRRK